MKKIKIKNKKIKVIFNNLMEKKILTLFLSMEVHF